MRGASKEAGARLVEEFHSLLAKDDSASHPGVNIFRVEIGGVQFACWADPAVYDQGLWVSRVSLETILIRDFPSGSEASLSVAPWMGAGLFGLLRSGDGCNLCLRSSILVGEGNLEGLRPIFFYLFAVHGYSNHLWQDAIAKAAGCAIGEANGNREYWRNAPYADDFASAAEKARSRPWNKRERYEAIMDALGSSIRPIGSGDGTMLAELPYGTDSMPSVVEGTAALFSIEGNATHLLMGPGALLSLRIPRLVPDDQRAEFALKMNRLEQTSWTRCHFLGSWSLDSGLPMFNTFIPGRFCTPAYLEYFARQSIIRAWWTSVIARGARPEGPSESSDCGKDILAEIERQSQEVLGS